MKKLIVMILIFATSITLQSGDIIEEASKAGLSAFVNAVSTSDLTESAKQTESPAPFTVFIPSNLAFAQANLNQTREVLRPIIMYHVIPGFNLTKAQLLGKLESIAGSYVTIASNGRIQGASEIATVNRSIPCSNGIIHIIDKVLTPTEDENDD